MSIGRFRDCGLVEGTNISVDDFRVSASVYLVSHGHVDHHPGLDEFLSQAKNDAKIMCSETTAALLQLRFKSLRKSQIQVLEDHESVEVRVDELGKVRATVTAMPANHCPGAKMFLLDGFFGRVLHTGDFRFAPPMCKFYELQAERGPVDVLYMDTTFAAPFWSALPSQAVATEQIVALVDRYLGANKADRSRLVMVEAELLGLERLLVVLAKRYRVRVCVTEQKYAALACIAGFGGFVSRHFTLDESSTFLRCVPHKHLASLDAAARGNALLIKPSTQWFGPHEQQNALADVETYARRLCLQHGIYHVLYSIHSSRAELKAFVRHVKPRRIVPTVQVSATHLHSLAAPYLDRTRSHRSVVPPSIAQSSSSSSSSMPSVVKRAATSPSSSFDGGDAPPKRQRLTQSMPSVAKRPIFADQENHEPLINLKEDEEELESEEEDDGEPLIPLTP
jgi:DNA cross-link repair 1B protein